MARRPLFGRTGDGSLSLACPMLRGQNFIVDGGITIWYQPRKTRKYSCFICDIWQVDPGLRAARMRAMQASLRILRHLAIVALFVRALLPAGWMPDAQGQLVICSATLGMVHHDSAPGHHDQQAGEECPFALAAVAVPAPDAPQIALPAAHAFAARTDAARAAVIAARYTPGSPRAPPLNA